PPTDVVAHPVPYAVPAQVTITFPTTPYALDGATVTDAGAEFTIDGSALAAGATLSFHGAGAGANQFVYDVTGPLEAGDVVVTFIAGSWSFVDGGSGDLLVTLGEVGPDAPFIVHEGAVAIDVPFPVAPGHHVDVTTLGEFDEFTLGGAGLGTVAL